MPQRKPAGFPAVVPHITVDDAAAAIDFYKRAFGAVEVVRHLAPDGRRVMHASITIEGAPVMLNDDFPEYCGGQSRTPRALGGSPVTIHLNLPDVDAAWKRAIKAGAEVTMPLADQFWGDRYGVVRDPFGHAWSMATHKRKPSDEEIRKGAEEAFGAAPPAKRASGSTRAKPAATKAPAPKGATRRR